MSVTDHALVIDFPEYKDKIKQLESDNPEFHSLSTEYHELDKEIRALEGQDVPTTDEHFNEMKMRRAHLKDQLYGMLQ